ncbi:MAG: HAMP domain-containing sensor histidine kinase, partial [Candidatus Paceibacterota bacterium]
TEQIINKFKAYAEASNIEITFNTEEPLSNVVADPSQTKSVIENLLDNAIRYIKGKGKIEISIRKRGDFLLFSIKDTGVGIPQKDQKHIFQKFFRSANVMKHQTQGSGLGLYIVKSIVEMCGGKIWFNSREGEGTTFLFTLPIKKNRKTVDNTR